MEAISDYIHREDAAIDWTNKESLYRRMGAKKSSTSKACKAIEHLITRPYTCATKEDAGRAWQALHYHFDILSDIHDRLLGLDEEKSNELKQSLAP